MAYNNYSQPNYNYYPNQNMMYQPSITGVAQNTALPSYTTPQFQTQQPQQGIVWVQGEAGAKSYMVGAGQSVLLMDSDESCFYIKSADASGMPLPLRTFDYKERNTQQSGNAQIAHHDEVDYVTRKEFDELKQLIDDLTK